MANFYQPVKRQSVQRHLTVQIHALDAFGQGVAAHQGKTIFVSHALPGETVQVALYQEKKQFAKARVLHYLSQSPERVKPECPHYGMCGGCQMQHIAPQQQLAAKQQALLKQLRDASGLALQDIPVDVVQAAPYHYRRRARLAIDISRKPIKLGFRQANQKQIVNITVCPILQPQLAALIAPLQQLLNQLQQPKYLGHLELLQVDSGTVVVLRHTKPLPTKDLQLLQQFAKQQQLSLFLHGEALVCLHGEAEPYYRLDELTLFLSPLDFIQVNAEINQLMVQKVVDWLELTATDHVLDLYCGMGNFSLPAAKRVAKVIGVEGVAALVAKARANAQANLLTERAEFVQHDLSLAEPAAWLTAFPFNKVILDPGRDGAWMMALQLAKLQQAQQIVYISCNPATLARDSQPLIAAGYQIQRIAMLEMFPQTKHLEAMVLFTRT